MELEKIALLHEDRDKVVVLDGSRPHSHFRMPFRCEDSFFKRDGFIYANTSAGLLSYDLEGNLRWNYKDFYSDFLGVVGYDEEHIYIANPVIRSEVDEEKDSEKIDVMGTEVRSFDSLQTDLWISAINYSGKVKWQKFIEENSAPLGNFLRVTSDYILVHSGNDFGKRILVVDKKGELRYKIDREFDYPTSKMFCVGEDLAFFTKEGGRRDLEIYDLVNQRTKDKIQVPGERYIYPLEEHSPQSQAFYLWTDQHLIEIDQDRKAHQFDIPSFYSRRVNDYLVIDRPELPNASILANDSPLHIEVYDIPTKQKLWSYFYQNEKRWQNRFRVLNNKVIVLDGQRVLCLKANNGEVESSADLDCSFFDVAKEIK